MIKKYNLKKYRKNNEYTSKKKYMIKTHKEINKSLKKCINEINLYKKIFTLFSCI